MIYEEKDQCPRCKEGELRSGKSGELECRFCKAIIRSEFVELKTLNIRVLAQTEMFNKLKEEQSKINDAIAILDDDIQDVQARLDRLGANDL